MYMQLGPYCTVSVETGPVTGVEVVRVGGEIDTSTTDDLWPMVEAETGRAARAVVVELSEVTFFARRHRRTLAKGDLWLHVQ